MLCTIEWPWWSNFKCAIFAQINSQFLHVWRDVVWNTCCGLLDQVTTDKIKWNRESNFFCSSADTAGEFYCRIETFLYQLKPYNVLRFQGQTLTQGTYNTHWSTIKYDVNLRDHSFIIYLLLSFSSIPSRNNCRVFSEWPEVINTTDRGRINDLFQQQQLSIKFREPERSPAGCCYYLEEGTLKRRRGKLAVFETYKIQWGKSYVRCEE